jgi:hypothetical protein
LRLSYLACGKKDLARIAALPCKADHLGRELAGKNPSVLERLLAETIATNWLQLQCADYLCAEQPGNEQRERSQARAHKRYLAALKSLALIRRLAVPMLQVNVANKQRVNNQTSPQG